MRLPGPARMAVTGGLAVLTFLALFLELQLVWWLSFVLASLVYGAGLLIVGQRPALDDIHVADRVTAADIKALGEDLTGAARRLDALSKEAPAEDQDEIAEMAGNLTSIRRNVEANAKGYRTTKRFTDSFLPVIVSTIAAYNDLATRAGPEQQDRLREIGDTIHGFAPAIRQIERATVEKDFAALEAEVSALSTQLNRRL